MLYTIRHNGVIQSQHDTEHAALGALVDAGIGNVSTSEDDNIRYVATGPDGSTYTVTIEPKYQSPAPVPVAPTPQPIPSQPQPIPVAQPRRRRKKAPSQDDYSDLIASRYASCLNMALIILLVIMVAGFIGAIN